MSDEARGAVEVRDVVKRYGDTTVLDHVSMDVADGEFVAVTGRSGVGKPSLLHLLAALDRPDGGTIRVSGLELGRVHALTRYRRHDIGLVFQLHNLIPRLTAAQNVAIAMYGTGRHRHQIRDRSRALLDDVGLADHADAKPPVMSGGERQRVAVARALANGPAVLLADEPTGSLDDQSADQVLDLFQRLRDEQGTTILAVTHDQRLSARADRLFELRGGRLA